MAASLPALDKKHQKVFPNVPIAMFRNATSLKDNYFRKLEAVNHVGKEIARSAYLAQKLLLAQ